MGLPAELVVTKAPRHKCSPCDASSRTRFGEHDASGPVRYEQTSRAGYYRARDYRPAHIADLLVKVVS